MSTIYTLHNIIQNTNNTNYHITNTNYQNTKVYQLHKNISKLTRVTCPTDQVATTFSFPGMSATLKEYSWTATAHLNTRSFWYAVSFRYFKGLWPSSEVKFKPLDTPYNR